MWTKKILLLLRREGELYSLHRVESFFFLSVSVSLSAFAFSADSLSTVSLCELCHSAMSLCYVSLSALSLSLYLSLLWLSAMSRAVVCVSLLTFSVDYFYWVECFVCLSVCLSVCLFVCADSLSTVSHSARSLCYVSLSAMSLSLLWLSAISRTVVCLSLLTFPVDFLCWLSLLSRKLSLSLSLYVCLSVCADSLYCVSLTNQTATKKSTATTYWRWCGRETTR